LHSAVYQLFRGIAIFSLHVDDGPANSTSLGRDVKVVFAFSFEFIVDFDSGHIEIEVVADNSLLQEFVHERSPLTGFFACTFTFTRAFTSRLACCLY